MRSEGTNELLIAADQGSEAIEPCGRSWLVVAGRSATCRICLSCSVQRAWADATRRSRAPRNVKVGDDSMTCSECLPRGAPTVEPDGDWRLRSVAGC